MKKRIISTILILGILILALSLGMKTGILGGNTGPTITLTDGEGQENLVMKLGDTYEEPGYTASSGRKDLTDQVEVNLPDFTKPGEYTITYTVTDEKGRTAEAVRTVTVELGPQTEAGAARGISVLMYHYVYDPENPPEDMTWANNYITTTALEEELKYLEDEGYYFPTWKELRAYIDGEVDLPEKSVILTFDDGAGIFEDFGVPLIEKYDVKATAFIIASKNGEYWVNKNYQHLDLQSHSYDMHKAGGSIGHGGILTAMTKSEIIEDLTKSKEILGSGDAFAYPYGDYTQESETAVSEAGFLVAFTTAYGKVYPGDDPYALPRVRVIGSPSLSEFKSII